MMSETKIDIIFRCGWCGFPCKDNGECLEMNNGEANEYLLKHKDSEEKLVNGYCCPNGN